MTMPLLGAIIVLSVTLRGANDVKDEILENEIRVATEIARQHSEDLYGYYMTMRPPQLGAQPANTASSVSLKFRTYHDELNQDIWGWVCYTRPLTLQEVQEYELLPDETNPVRYIQYGLIRKTLTESADGKREVKQQKIMDKTGKPFLTSYPRKALALMQEMNDKALDSNNKDTVSAVRVVKIMPKS